MAENILEHLQKFLGPNINRVDFNTPTLAEGSWHQQ